MKRALSLLLLTGCLQSTGGDLVTFDAEAVGTPAGAAFTTPKGYAVTLSRAQVRVGALYLNQTNPADWSLESSCILPGIYAGEVRGGLTLDALSGAAQPFPVRGNGTDAHVQAGEVWLSEGDVNDDSSNPRVLDVEGTATLGADSWPFKAAFTIGKNRQKPPRDAALPGSSPICKQRIVSPVPADLQLQEGGTLRLVVDPRGWFTSVEFSELKMGSGTQFEFIDDSTTAGQPDLALFNGMRAVKGPYAFQWSP